MKKSLIFLALILAGACASQRSSNAVAEPEVRIDQLSSTPAVAEHVTGGMPVQFRMSVTNTAQFPITLKRAELQSVGSGGYNINPTSRPFDIVLAPGATETVDFWVPAYAATSVAGVNGAVALRLITEYDSPSGKFRNVGVHQVMGRIQ
jgi:hypothetical protein